MHMRRGTDSSSATKRSCAWRPKTVETDMISTRITSIASRPDAIVSSRTIFVLVPEPVAICRRRRGRREGGSFRPLWSASVPRASDVSAGIREGAQEYSSGLVHISHEAVKLSCWRWRPAGDYVIGPRETRLPQLQPLCALSSKKKMKKRR